MGVKKFMYNDNLSYSSRNEQNLTRTLLNEQNEAFQASLAADQEKALKRKQEEEAIRQAELAQQEKEDAKQKRIEVMPLQIRKKLVSFIFPGLLYTSMN